MTVISEVTEFWPEESPKLQIGMATRIANNYRKEAILVRGEIKFRQSTG